MRLRRALIVLSTLAMAAPLAVTAAASPGTPTLDIMLGVDKDNLPTIPLPTALDVTSSGNVYVAAGDGIERMTSVGEPKWTFNLGSDTGVVMVDAQNGFMTYSGSSDIQTVDQSGAGLHHITLGPTDNPTSLAYDAASPFAHMPVVYAVLANSGRIAEENATDLDAVSGDADVAIFGSHALAVAVAPDHTVVVARDDGGFDRYTSQGVRIMSSKEVAGGVTSGANGLAVDSAGTVFLASGSGEIVEADLAGHRIGAFGQPNPDYPGVALPGDFNDPTDVAIDCEGRLFVLDVNHSTNKAQVDRFSGVAAPTGTCDPPVTNTSFPVVNGAAGMVAVDKADDVYVSANQTIEKYDAAGHHVTGWGSTSEPENPSNPSTYLPGHWGLTSGLTALPNGDVLVASWSWIDSSGLQHVLPNGVLEEFRPAGAYVRTITGATGGPLFVHPGGLRVRPSDGHLFVVDAGTGAFNVQELDASFNFVRSYTPLDLGGGVAHTVAPTAVGFDYLGHVAVAARQSTGTGTQFSAVQIFDQTTGAHIGPDVNAPVVGGSGETITGIGNDFGGAFVFALGAVAAPTYYPGAADGVLATGGNFDIRLLDPQLAGALPRLAVDCAGRIYVAGFVTSRVYRLIYSDAKCTWLPTATTGAVASRTTTSLTVKGSANPSAQVTKIRMLYGATTKYGKATAWITLPSDNVTITKSFVLSGLLHAHTYHYKVQAQNASGTVNGKDRTGSTK